MKLLKDNIGLIGWVGAAILLTLQIKSCSDPKPVNETEIRNDEKRKALEREILYKDSVHNVAIALKDTQIAILSQRITINRGSIQQSNDRIKTLPARISSMSIDDVLRTIEQ